MTSRKDSQGLIDDKTTTLSIALYELLIHTTIVQSLSKTYLAILGPTQSSNIEMPITVDVLIIPLVQIVLAPMEEVITLALPMEAFILMENSSI